MVGLEELAALDLTLWLRHGAAVAERCNCNPSTISRRLARARAVFALQLKRHQGEWELVRPSPLLDLEREVHQFARVLGQAPLRLEICPYLQGLAQPPYAGWMLGVGDHFGVGRPLALLADRVIDAWLCDTLQDVPQGPDSPFAVLPLVALPVAVVADAAHPLVGVPGVGPADLRRFPSLALAPQAYPVSRQRMAAWGLATGSRPQSLQRYDPLDWEGLTADRAPLAYATPFSLPLTPFLAPLDCPPLFFGAVGLVCRRDLAAQEPIVQLLGLIADRIRVLRPELTALPLAMAA